MDITIGADPEVFVMRDGKPYSAWDMIPGTKQKPHKVKDGAVQVDGNALEYNIAPAADAKTFVHNIHSVLSILESMIPKDCKIAITPSVHFDWDHLKALPKEALILGCDPDFNAYTGEANARPDNNTNMRTAAGHVHIGWTKKADIQDELFLRECRAIVEQLDCYLGIPSLLLDPDTERRKMYGKAGAFRPKPYGVEYRVLSNFWLKSPALTEWVFNTTKLALDALLAGDRITKRYCIYPQNIINNDWQKGQLERYMKMKYPSVWDKINTFQHLLPKE